MNYPTEHCTITLYTPIEMPDGSVLKELNLREPRVRDRIAFAKDHGTEEEKEARMIAALCNLSEQEIWRLTAADYIQLTDQFNVFMLPPEKRMKTLSSEGSVS